MTVKEKATKTLADLFGLLKEGEEIFIEDLGDKKRKTAVADLEVTNYDIIDYEFAEGEEANLVTSLVEGNRHAPVLDIDIPHHLVPSSTEGHSHLYLDILVDWDDYVEFLKAGAKIGIFEQGFVNAAIARGLTAVRKPGVKKLVTDANY